MNYFVAHQKETTELKFSSHCYLKHTHESMKEMVYRALQSNVTESTLATTCHMLICDIFISIHHMIER